jgi:hypothetical protein
MRRLCVLLLAVLSLAACGGSDAPEWLKAAAKVQMRKYFGNAEPERVDYVLGSRTHRVICDFGRFVHCVGCRRPPAARHLRRYWPARYGEATFDVRSRELRVFSVSIKRERLYGEKRD